MDFPTMIEDDYEGAVALAEEMLAALKAYVEADGQTGVSEVSLTQYDRKMERALKLARAAIAKAEGRAND